MAIFLNSVIDIKREAKTGVTDLGTDEFSTSTVKANLRVSLKRTTSSGNNDIFYSESGQIIVPDYILVCETYLDIRSKDIIEIVSSDLLTLTDGLEFRVINEPYIGTLFKHVQVILKKGVE